MKPDEQATGNKGRARKRKIDLELYYYERVGDRYYFRITTFGLILVIGATILSLGIILFMNLIEPSPREFNTNITVPSTTPFSSNKSVIRQAPPPAPPPNIKQPKYSIPVPATSPTTAKNNNEQLTPNPSPRPSPPSPPP